MGDIKISMRPFELLERKLPLESYCKSLLKFPLPALGRKKKISVSFERNRAPRPPANENTLTQQPYGGSPPIR